MTTFYTFTNLISPVARKQAEKWSRQQATAAKSQQILLNTLAVSFMNFYLKCMGFETDLQASDSWNPVQQTLMNVADLFIKNIGNLECLPVLENADCVFVPPEVQSNRIGYVVVEISQSLQSAKLLGFVEQVSNDKLPFERLEPIENLLHYLESFKNQNVNLKRWLDRIFEPNWVPVESVFFAEPALQFRSAGEEYNNSVERAKLIDFGIQNHRDSVWIVVRINSENNKSPELKVTVELHPKHGQKYLPPSVEIVILDDEGTAVMEAKAKKDNRNIDLQFLGSEGDKFSVKIITGDVSAIENFVI